MIAILPVFGQLFVADPCLVLLLISGHFGDLYGAVARDDDELGFSRHPRQRGATLLLFVRAYSLGGNTYTNIETRLERRADQP